MPRSPRPDDLYRLRIPTDPRLSPDGRFVVVTLQTVAPGHDGYRTALWSVPTDGRDARQLTLGARHDHHPRFAPDGRRLAFLSDRRTLVEEEPDRARELATSDEDSTQVYVLPLEGGEAQRLTDLPRGVEGFAWAPDGRSLVVTTSSRGATRGEDARRRGIDLDRPSSSPPESDVHFIDRLDYMHNGTGFTYHARPHLWVVDATSGHARRLTDGPVPDESAAWSPDGGRIAFASNRRRDHDLIERSDIWVVDPSTGALTAITAGPSSVFHTPTWLPDGRTLAVLGHRLPAASASRNDVWLFAADGSDAHPDGGRNLSATHDLMPGASLIGDITQGEPARLAVSPDGAWILFTAPIRGSYELWRIAIEDGRVERLTEGRHYLSSFDIGVAGRAAGQVAWVESSPTEPPDLWLLERVDGRPRRLTTFNADVLDGVELREPQEHWHEVDGRPIQGWLIPGGPGPRPLVLEIHGGPHTLYGSAPVWEFQLLAAAGISVYFCNPRGSEGYGEAFNRANHRDWGPGPMRDVLAGVDALVAEGLADPDRLGVTGGSYGGYLTNWIVAHDQRFRAAMTCRSVADMTMLNLTGDISGLEWARLEFDVTPFEDPAYYWEISPVSHAADIRTPLLIQHAERDIRTTIGQAEALFTALRSLRRPVRLMRVPEETHELTRSGTPFRRVENLAVVLGWFDALPRPGQEGPPTRPADPRRPLTGGGRLAGRSSLAGPLSPGDARGRAGLIQPDRGVSSPSHGHHPPFRQPRPRACQ